MHASVLPTGSIKDTCPTLRVGPVAGRAPTGPPCVIQGTYGTPGQPNNFEALGPYGNVIMHGWRNNSEGSQQWTPSVAVSTNAIGLASLIQSTLTPGDGTTGAGILEAIVLEKKEALSHTMNGLALGGLNAHGQRHNLWLLHPVRSADSKHIHPWVWRQGQLRASYSSSGK